MDGSPRRDGGHWVHPILDQGWGMSRGWDCEGKAQPRRDKLAPWWLDLGLRGGGQPWRGACWMRGYGEVQKVGRRGGREEGGHVGGVLGRWGRAGSDRCPAGVRGEKRRGCRGAGRGALGCALAGLGLFHPTCSQEALASSCAAVSACKKDNPHGRAAAPHTLC